jgi:hypothetical protein
VQIAFGLYLVALYGEIGRTFWQAEGGGGSPKSPLYGIWNVEEMAIDGEFRPSQLNDYDRRWRRVIFEAPQWIFFQRTDDSFVRYGASINVQQNTLSLTKGRSRSWNSNFTFERPAHDRLVLEGQMDGHKINMQLQLVEFDTFRLRIARSSGHARRPGDWLLLGIDGRVAAAGRKTYRQARSRSGCSWSPDRQLGGDGVMRSPVWLYAFVMTSSTPWGHSLFRRVFRSTPNALRHRTATMS